VRTPCAVHQLLGDGLPALKGRVILRPSKLRELFLLSVLELRIREIYSFSAKERKQYLYPQELSGAPSK
jgi:hypothetical protein